MRSKMIFGGVLLLVIGALLGAGFAGSLGERVRREAPVQEDMVPTSSVEGVVEAPQTVSMMLDFGDGTVRTFQNVDIGDKKTVFDVTQALSLGGNGFALSFQPPGQYGTLVEQIGNKKGGEEGKYWLFWVNNAMAEQAADRTPVNPGDVIEWKFINLKMEEAPQS